MKEGKKGSGKKRSTWKKLIRPAVYIATGISSTFPTSGAPCWPIAM